MKSLTHRKGIEVLQFNHAGAMLLEDGNSVNYGVIRIDNEKVVYYTGKGLREMWKPDMTPEEKDIAEKLKKIGEENDGEEKLVASGHIAVTQLEQIMRVIF